jgi:hypothetical protein
MANGTGLAGKVASFSQTRLIQLAEVTRFLVFLLADGDFVEQGDRLLK